MSKRGYKEWARHLRPEGKRAAAKAARRQALAGLETEPEVSKPSASRGAWGPVWDSVPHDVVEPGEEDVDALMPCPKCNARNSPMGGLGTVLHYSCRWCGWWYYGRIRRV